MRIPVLHVRNYLLLAHFYVSGAKGFDCKRPIGFPRALWDCETPLGDYIREFRIQYDGDDNYLRNVEVIGLYTIVGFVKGGSPMYRHMDSGGHNNYIYRDPNGDKPGEDKYGSIWKGVLSFENVGADKDKYTWLVPEGCKSEKIAECENWAFFLKNDKMSAMQKDLVQGGFPLETATGTPSENATSESGAGRTANALCNVCCNEPDHDQCSDDTCSGWKSLCITDSNGNIIPNPNGNGASGDPRSATTFKTNEPTTTSKKRISVTTTSNGQCNKGPYIAVVMLTATRIIGF